MNREFSLRIADKRLRIYLPHDVCENSGITPGSVLKVRRENGCIVISPVIVRDPHDTMMEERVAYTQACIRGMDADSLKQLQASVTQRALELAEKTKPA